MPNHRSQSNPATPDPLAVLLRQAATADAPQFSPELHRRFVQAIQQQQPVRLQRTWPRLVAGLAAAAAVVLLYLALPVMHRRMPPATLVANGSRHDANSDHRDALAAGTLFSAWPVILSRAGISPRIALDPSAALRGSGMHRDASHLARFLWRRANFASPQATP